LRLASFYAAVFAYAGVHLPFWPLWLAGRGLDAVEIGVVVAAGLAVKVFVNPLVAHAADRRGERKRLMVRLSIAAFAAFTLFGSSGGFLAILAVTLLYFAFQSAIMPLGESLTLLTAKAEGLDYGRIRLWGSLSFIGAAWGAGAVLAGRPPEAVFWLVALALVLSAAAALGLPDTRADRAARPRLTLVDVIRDRSFVLFLLAASFVQSSHAVYYGFATLEWRRSGYSETVIGALWAEGVVAEIVLFLLGARLLRRLGPERLIALGGLAGVARWTATGAIDSLPLLVVAQALHAFTFGAAHLGAMHYMAGRVAPQLSATAQSLYSVAVMGIALGAATLLAGVLYDAFGAGAYFPMAAFGFAGAAIALALGRRGAAGRPA
jgi:PPP family 3-phenylpropionic acid transporter